MSIESFFTLTGNNQGFFTAVNKPVGDLSDSQSQALEFMKLVFTQMGEDALTTSSDSSALYKQPLDVSGAPQVIDGSEITGEAVAPFIVDPAYGPVTPATGHSEGIPLPVTLGEALALNQQSVGDIIQPLSTEKISIEAALAQLQNFTVTEEVLKTPAPDTIQTAFALEGLDSVPADLDLSIESIVAALQQLQGSAAEKAIKLNLETFQTAQDMADHNPAALQAIFEVAQVLLPQIQRASANKPAIEIIQPNAQPGLFSATQQTSPLDGALNALTPRNHTANLALTTGESIAADGDSAFDFDFKDFLKSLQGDLGGKNHVKADAAQIPVKTQAQTQAGNVQYALPALSSVAGQESALSTDPSRWLQSFGESMNSLNAAAPATGLHHATNLIANTAHAGASHPATQLVAITMQKSAMNGQAKSIRIQLDPAELGRVEVNMTFAKDKSMKAVLTVEKPETYLMLQRDTHALERAMNALGFDADGGMSFEMAQDGQNFGQDGRHDGSRNNARNGSSSDDGDMDLIETTMTWNVDPKTGHTRYDIWV